MNLPKASEQELESAYIKIGAELKEKARICSDSELGFWVFRYVESFYCQTEVIRENDVNHHKLISQ